jgi:hypothetical protein
MRKTGLLTIVAILLASATILSAPVLAAGLEYTKTVLYFNVGALDEVTVTLVNEGAGTATGAGIQTASSLNFTCGSANCAWFNASLSGGGGTQSDATPAVTIDNTGTTNAQINISANYTFPGTTCMNLRYSNATITNPPTLALNVTNVTLVEAYAPADAALKVWLFGNFSACTQQVYVAEFNVYALFA